MCMVKSWGDYGCALAHVFRVSSRIKCLGVSGRDVHYFAFYGLVGAAVFPPARASVGDFAEFDRDCRTLPDFQV